MKFNEIAPLDWEENKAYLDTCLLPITGLTGAESPWEVTQALEQLRDYMDHVEIPFKGRVVTYPAVQYRSDDGQMEDAVDKLCQKLKLDSFKYVILITTDEALARLDFKDHDLMLSPLNIADFPEKARAIIMQAVQKLWI